MPHDCWMSPAHVCSYSWAYPEDTDNGLLMLSDEQIAELQAKIAAHEETLQPRSSRDNWRARGPRSKGALTRDRRWAGSLYDLT